MSTRRGPPPLPPSGRSRRELLRLWASAAAVAPVAGAVSPLYVLASPRAMAQGATPRRFLQIFLLGGWDSILATDPIAAGGAKAAGGKYQPAYYTAADPAFPGAPVPVPGKPRLSVGPGLAAAVPGFAAVPTAFVNGLYIEVTAHELAVNYVYSGQLSLSRTRQYPAIIATMADRTGGFPAHVILGEPLPLAGTAATNPPLQSGDVDAYVKMLAGPYKSLSSLKAGSIDAAHTLVGQLNDGLHQRLGPAGLASLAPWGAAEGGLTALYARRYDQRLGLTAQLTADFGAGTDPASAGARLALAYQTLKEGLSSFVTVTCGGFDTHRNHLATHLPVMRQFATGLNALLAHLAATPDPAAPALSLAETTTILVLSEFVRTPLFNLAGGTDHWQAGAAIVMGRGVRDNTVVGSTDTAGNAAPYGAGKLLPDHLAASTLRMMGFGAEADLVSGVHLDALYA